MSRNEYSISFGLDRDIEGFKIVGSAGVCYRGGGSGFKRDEERLEKLCEEEVVEKVRVLREKGVEKIRGFLEREYGLRGEIEFDVEYRVGSVCAKRRDVDCGDKVVKMHGYGDVLVRELRVKVDEEEKELYEGLIRKGIESLV